jgi:hypothetical protein
MTQSHFIGTAQGLLLRLEGATSDQVAALQLLAEECGGLLRGCELLLPWNLAWEMDDETAGLLRLPRAVVPEVFIHCRGTPALAGFSIETKLSLGQQPIAKTSIEYGLLRDARLGLARLPPSIPQAIALSAAISQASAREQRFADLARLHTLSQKEGWGVAAVLREFKHVEALEIDLQQVAAGEWELDLMATGSGGQALPADQLRTWAKERGIGVRLGAKAGESRYVLLGDQVRTALKRSKARRVVGADIVRLARDPSAFLQDEDETIDLAAFSKRVKGLVPLVYRSAPYVRSEPSGIDWFSVERRSTIYPEDQDDLDEAASSAKATSTCDLGEDEWADAVQRAFELGSDLIEWRDGWLEIQDAEGEWKRLQAQRECAPGGRIRADQRKKVLQIYENIDALEYTEDLLRTPESLPDVGPPPGFRPDKALKPHQRLGLNWLHAHWCKRSGVLLADEMGVGKTAQVLALLRIVTYGLAPGGAWPCLVILPSAVLQQWKDEAQVFVPDLDIRVVHGRQGFDLTRFSVAEPVIVASYDAVRHHQTLFAKPEWGIVACDEAQRVKNKTAQVSHAVKALKARMRIAMSGTPVENSLGEYWNLFDLIRPGLLKSHREFAAEFERPMRGDDGVVVRDRLVHLTAPYVLRRLKKDHVPGLADLERHRHPIPLTEEQLALVLAKLDELEELEADQRRGIFFKYAHWVQRCLFSPDLADDTATTNSPKVDACLGLVEEAWQKGERSLIIAESKRIQLRLKVLLEQRYGAEPSVITGETPAELRSHRAKNFGNNACPAMLVSPRAGGVGLNITAASHVIFPTRLFNPAPEEQAIARAWRMGQARTVHVHYLIAHGEIETFDQKLDLLLERKRQLANDLLQPIEELRVSEGEWSDLLRSWRVDLTGQKT